MIRLTITTLISVVVIIAIGSFLGWMFGPGPIEGEELD